MASRPLSIQRFQQSFMSQVMKAASESSLVVKVVTVSVVFLYCVGLFPGTTAQLSISPGTLFPQFRIWTILTAGAYEQHIWNVILDVVVMFVGGVTLEPLWGGEEFLKFVAILHLATPALVVVLYFILYAALRQEALLFTSYYGMSGLLAGIAVAMKQVMPDQSITPASIMRLRVKHVPFLAVCIVFVLALPKIIPFTTLYGTVFGVLVSWSYLRFFQWQGSGADRYRGDHSQAFSFASLFPELVQPVVVPLAAILYGVVVALRLCPRQSQVVDIDKFNSTNVHMLTADAQRRRHKALKALDARLSKAPDEPESWPSMDGSELPKTDPARSNDSGAGIHVIDIAEENAVPADVGNGDGSGPHGHGDATVEPAESAT